MLSNDCCWYQGRGGTISGGDTREIQPEILDRTTKCSHDFVCLEHNGNEYPRCGVKLDVTQRIIVVFSRRERCDACPYCISFGMSERSFICQCPTRIALFYRHNF
ncbi:MAG: hypothetical protein ACP5FL_02575 [Thermoplasmatota archaeon]